jgi:hypothetical protein
MPPEAAAFVGAVASYSYLRRDATALRLMLLSMSDITSSFHRMAVVCNPPECRKYRIP